MRSKEAFERLEKEGVLVPVKPTKSELEKQAATIVVGEDEYGASILPFFDPQPNPETDGVEAPEWPSPLLPRKRDDTLDPIPDDERPISFKGSHAVKKLVASYMRMRDVGRLINMGMKDNLPGDVRGYAAVALVQLGKYKDAARLACGPDGKTGCYYNTLRYVAHSLAKVGAFEGALHCAQVAKFGVRQPDNLITPRSWSMQIGLEVCALFLQATTNNQPQLLAAHGQLVSGVIEQLYSQYRSNVLATTPSRRYRMLTEAFNQVVRWYGRARLVPQALRALEIMTDLGVPRDDLTMHFLSKACAQQWRRKVPHHRLGRKLTPNLGSQRPETLFVGRVNAGKSQMINTLLSAWDKSKRPCPVHRNRATTRQLDLIEVNDNMTGLPFFGLVDSPGLGHAEQRASVTRSFPVMISEYLKTRTALRHVFHLVDVRARKLRPADRQLIHLLGAAHRPDVRYTIVVSKIDVCSRKKVAKCVENIREELAPYIDVDIICVSASSKRGVDQLWSLIWRSMTETPRGRKHRDLGPRELELLRDNGVPQEADLASLLGLPPLDNEEEPFRPEEWEERDVKQVDPSKRGKRTDGKLFDDDLDDDEDMEKDDIIDSIDESEIPEFLAEFSVEEAKEMMAATILAERHAEKSVAAAESRKGRGIFRGSRAGSASVQAPEADPDDEGPAQELPASLRRRVSTEYDSDDDDEFDDDDDDDDEDLLEDTDIGGIPEVEEPVGFLRDLEPPAAADQAEASGSFAVPDVEDITAPFDEDALDDSLAGGLSDPSDLADADAWDDTLDDEDMER